jgi:hypothetical protein
VGSSKYAYFSVDCLCLKHWSNPWWHWSWWSCNSFNFNSTLQPFSTNWQGNGVTSRSFSNWRTRLSIFLLQDGHLSTLEAHLLQMWCPFLHCLIGPEMANVIQIGHSRIFRISVISSEIVAILTWFVLENFFSFTQIGSRCNLMSFVTAYFCLQICLSLSFIFRHFGHLHLNRDHLETWKIK